MRRPDAAATTAAPKTPTAPALSATSFPSPCLPKAPRAVRSTAACLINPITNVLQPSSLPLDPSPFANEIARSSAQGAQILQIQTNKKYCNKRPGCVFHLSFTNEGDYKYCKKDPDCTPDDNLYTKDGPITSGVARRASEGGRYMLASGKTICKL